MREHALAPQRDTPVGLPSMMRAATIELSTACLPAFNADVTVDFLADHGVNTIVCCAVGYAWGEAYYPSAYAAPHPASEGRDVVGEVCAATLRRGLGFMVYVNGMWAGPDIVSRHPEWMQRRVDGTVTEQAGSHAMCPNSPYKQVVVGLCAELADRYPIAGLYLDEPSFQSWCACTSCENRFRQDTGFELPRVLQQGEQEFAAFLAWRTRVISEFVDRVGSAVRETRPGVNFFCQHAFPLSSTAYPQLRAMFGELPRRRPPQWEGWYRPTAHGQDIAALARVVDIVAIEPWRRFNDQSPWWIGACASYARAVAGAKRVVTLMEFPHFPWARTTLSGSELSANCADVYANGSDVWFPIYAPDNIREEGLSTVARTVRYLEGLRAPDAQQVAQVAVLVSRQSAERYGNGYVEERYLDDLIGSIQLLRELHLLYRVLSEDTLTTGDLEGLSLLMLPSAASLKEAAAQQIRQYVATGGSIFASGWIGTHDHSGAFRTHGLLDDVLGARIGPGTLDAGIGYLVPRYRDGAFSSGIIPVHGLQPALRPDYASVLMDVQPSWELYGPPAASAPEPALVLHSYGRGQALYSSVCLGRLRRCFGVFEVRALLQNLLSTAGLTAWDIEAVDIAPEVGIHAWRTSRQVFIFLVNYTSVEETGEAAHLGPQRLRIARAVLPESWTVSCADGAPVNAENIGPSTVLTIRGLEEWTCIIVSDTSSVEGNRRSTRTGGM